METSFEQQNNTALFLSAWNRYVETPNTSLDRPYDLSIEVGQIRRLPFTRRETLVIVAREWDKNSTFTIIPISPIKFPATNEEIKLCGQVFQAWAFRTMFIDILRQSWVTGLAATSDLCSRLYKFWVDAVVFGNRSREQDVGTPIEYTDDLRIVYKNVEMTNMHEYDRKEDAILNR